MLADVTEHLRSVYLAVYLISESMKYTIPWVWPVDVVFLHHYYFDEITYLITISPIIQTGSLVLYFGYGRFSQIPNSADTQTVKEIISDSNGRDPTWSLVN